MLCATRSAGQPASYTGGALQEFLRSFKDIKNCVKACDQVGLFKRLEEQQGDLEVCEKALADFKESKRRAFPRFYFISSNDLLDILSNGASHNAVDHEFAEFVKAGDKL